MWKIIEPIINEAGTECKHLLWSLVFLKINGSLEDVHCAIVEWPCKQTFSEWSWCLVEKICDFQDDVIVFGNQFNGQPDLNDIKFDCMISIDGIDCLCSESYPFSTDVFSKKFDGPGIKYEVGICIKTGYIVWINRPFLAGNSEATIFRGDLATRLEDWEFIEADTGLQGCNKARIPHQGISTFERKEKSIVRGRHENVNGRLKVFNVLVSYFHHDSGRDRQEMFNRHGMYFAVVLVMTQLKSEHGES